MSDSRLSLSEGSFIFQSEQEGFLELASDANQPRFDGLLGSLQLPGNLADGPALQVFPFDQLFLVGGQDRQAALAQGETGGVRLGDVGRGGGWMRMIREAVACNEGAR